MLITYKTVNKVRFPVYKILDTYVIEGKRILTERGRIVDDKNLPGDSLGVRRLYIKDKDKAALNNFIPDYLTLLKSGVKRFIDSNGNIHRYNKTKVCKIKVHEIEKIDKRGNHSLIYLKYLDFPILYRSSIPSHYSHAEIVYIDSFPWTIYNFLDSEIPSRSYIRI